MRVVIDIETNSLAHPSKVWVIVCKDIDTEQLHVFREPTEVQAERDRFLEFVDRVTLWVGHNWLEFDYPNLVRLLGVSIDDVASISLDTLILSRLFNYSSPHSAQSGGGRDTSSAGGEVDGAGSNTAPGSSVIVGTTARRNGSVIKGHSIESYGEEFGIPKLLFNDWTKYSKEMEEYCVRDVEICYRIYLRYLDNITDPVWAPSIRLEHEFQLIVNRLHDNGFCFNSSRASILLRKVEQELQVLDKEIGNAFPPTLHNVREVSPRVTRYGTLHKGDFRFVDSQDLSEYNGGPFCRCEWVHFNPASHKQIINVLSMAGWSPTDKTQSHIDAERELNHLKYKHNRTEVLDNRIKELYIKLEGLKKTGYKINENNLSTLPSSAPAPARLLAKRILLESRRRTLVEWLGLVQEDGRIHGKFYGIGAWTHRMAHQQPNTANIPTGHAIDGSVQLYGKELRSLWQAPRNRLLVGVDAEGIQLRIFAHYIDDEEFTDALVRGKKNEKTDPHSLNQRILGSACRSRNAAKRFIYALLLGAGISKLAQILECSKSECTEALDRLLERYTGFSHLKKTIIPKDARNGYFYGLDGRKVFIPGDTEGERKHLAMSGYLQNGEAIIMKRAAVKWHDKLKEDKSLLVNMVHDEWQTEVVNSMEVALRIAKTQALSLAEVGVELKLRCPLAGSYRNDKDYTIGTNWYQTH